MFLDETETPSSAQGQIPVVLTRNSGRASPHPEKRRCTGNGGNAVVAADQMSRHR